MDFKQVVNEKMTPNQRKDIGDALKAFVNVDEMDEDDIELITHHMTGKDVPSQNDTKRTYKKLFELEKQWSKLVDTFVKKL